MKLSIVNVIAGVIAAVSSFTQVAASSNPKSCPQFLTNWCDSSSSASSSAVATHSDNSNPRCARLLEQIVFAPPNAARNYLLKLMTQLTLSLSGEGDPFLMQSAMSKIKVFVNKYDVWVYLQPEFSSLSTVVYKPAENHAIPAPRFFGHLIAPTYLNLNGFDVTEDSTGKVERYAISQYNAKPEKVAYTLIISASAKNQVFYKC